VLVRADSGGGKHEFLEWLTARRLHYPVGMTVTEDVPAPILKIPARSWTSAYDGDGQVREGAWVADITGLLDLSGWPGCGSSSPWPPTPGADRIRGAKDTGLRRLPPKGFAQDQVWYEIVAVACELLAWTQLLTLTGTARRREPKRLRLRCSQSPGGAGPREPPPAAQARRAMDLGWRGHRRDHPRASPPVRPISPNATTTRGKRTPGPWNPVHPARQPGNQAKPRPENHPPADTPGQDVRDAKGRG
jgi:hypothetical protein